MIRVSVWKLGKWLDSKHGPYQSMQVQLKMIDEDNKTIKLNLQSDQRNKADWLRVLVEGNVLEVTDMTFNGQRIVNKFGPFRLLKPAIGKEAVDERGELPGQLTLPVIN